MDNADERPTSRAKGHHVVPRRYLERFADEQGLIVGHRFGGTSFGESVQRAARRNEFYTILGEDGRPSDAFELELANAEARFFPGIEAADITWPLPRQERELLAGWIALQILRSPLFREVHLAVGKRVIDDDLSPANRQLITAEIFDRHRGLANKIGTSPDELRALIKAEVDTVEKVLRNDAGSAVGQARSINKHLESVMTGLLERRWVAIRFTRRGLITSDNPIGLSRGGPGDVGLGNAVSVNFPLSRTTALVMLKHDGDDFVANPTTRMANWFNSSIIDNTRYVVYHHPADNPLKGLNIPTQPRGPYVLNFDK